MRLYQIKYTLQLLCAVTFIYLVVNFILNSFNTTPKLQETLQNEDFNIDQIRESNLFLADDFVPVPKPYIKQDGNKSIMLPVLPPRQTESLRLQQMRTQLRELNHNGTKMDDSRLTNVIRTYWLKPPSHKLYQLDRPELTDFSMGQSSVVDNILKQKEHGFFVECGALDGETRSNSLFFERERHWEGLLIEAGPINYRAMVAKNRKAWSSPACLGVKAYPTVMYFNRGKNRGRLIDGEEALQWIHSVKLSVWLMEVQCFPLYSLLVALNVTTVDYFSLDVEGVELDVLRTIPFDKLDIKVLTVEFIHNKEGKKALISFMVGKGYRNVAEITRDDKLANDVVFVKKDLHA